MKARIPLKIAITDKVDERLVFVDGVVVGRIRDMRFIQRVKQSHIFRKFNSKGIEFDVLERLLQEGDVGFWRLEFVQTGEVLEIPLRQIQQLGILDPPGSAGYQYHVKLRFFNQVCPAIQKEMFR